MHTSDEKQGRKGKRNGDKARKEIFFSFVFSLCFSVFFLGGGGGGGEGWFEGNEGAPLAHPHKWRALN